MLIPKKNRKEVYKYLFQGTWPCLLRSISCSSLFSYSAYRLWSHVSRDWQACLLSEPLSQDLRTQIMGEAIFNCRGCTLCGEGLQFGSSPWAARNSKSASHQADAELQVQGICDWALCMAPLLLVSIVISLVYDLSDTFIVSAHAEISSRISILLQGILQINLHHFVCLLWRALLGLISGKWPSVGWLTYVFVQVPDRWGCDLPEGVPQPALWCRACHSDEECQAPRAWVSFLPKKVWL